MKSEDLLKEVKSIFTVNLLDYIQKLNSKFSKHFMPPEKGIYFLNQIDPIIPEGMRVYSHQSLKEGIPLLTLDDVKSDILDNNGKIIIPFYYIERKEKCLSNKPNLPSRAYKVAAIIINEYVDSLLPYVEPIDFESQIKQHLTEEGLELWREGYFESPLTKLIGEISRFINIDIWNIYYTSFSGLDLQITKSCDFRAYEWTLNKEQEALRKQQEEEASRNI